MTDWRKVREDEKARYIEANEGKLPDVRHRWARYEDGILDRFGNRVYPPERREHNLDIAWERRDKYNSWASKRNNKRPQEANTATDQSGLPNDEA